MTWLNDLVRLHKAIQEKSKPNSDLRKDLVLESRMHYSEYFNVLEYLVWTLHEIKKVGGILAKPVPKKRKNYHHWNTSPGKKRLWRDNFSR